MVKMLTRRVANQTRKIIKVNSLLFGLIGICVLLDLKSYSQITSDRISPDWPKAGVEGGIPCWTKEVAITSLKSDGVTDNSTLLTTAMNTYKGTNTVLKIPAGTFLFTNRVAIPKEGGIVIKGEGPTKTIFKFTVGDISGNGCFNINAGSVIAGTETNVTAGLTKGSKSITVANATNISVGNWVEIDMANPSVITSNTAWNVSWADRCLGQIFKVLTKSGNVLTLDREVHITYPDVSTAKLRAIKMTEWVGFENFKVDIVCAATDDKYNFMFKNAANCWMKLVHSEKAVNRHVNTPGSSNLTITDCYFNGSWNNGNGGYGYGVVTDLHTTNCLIQDNVFNGLRHAMMCKLGANGNVFAYNYSANSNWPNNANNPPDINMHGHLPHMNLFEGNIACKIGADDVWGPSWDGTTYFRNRQTSVNSNLELDGPNINSNLVGNELIVSGKDIKVDALNTGTLIHGNNVAGNITWVNGVTQTLPNSYYLSNKPSWWGTAKWPSIGPTNTLNSGNNPAYERFLSNQLFRAYYCGDPNVVDCSGVIGGNAKIDNCGICAGGSTHIPVNSCKVCGSPFASSEDGVNMASNVLDKDLNTRWSAFGIGEFIEICLGDTLALNKVSMAFYKGNERATTFDLQASVDGKSWSTVLSNKISSGTTLALEDFTFAATQAWKIRIIGKGNSSPSDWVSINEVAWSSVITQLSSAFESVNTEIYPNPSDDLVHIPNNSLKKWELFNIESQRVLTGKDKEIDVSVLTNGVYFLNIINEDGSTKTFKLFKK